MTPIILTMLLAVNATPAPPSPTFQHAYYAPYEECGPRCRERRAWRAERRREYWQHERWRHERWRREHERYPYVPPPLRY